MARKIARGVCAADGARGPDSSERPVPPRPRPRRQHHEPAQKRLDDQVQREYGARITKKTIARRPTPGKLASMPFVDNILQPTHLLLVLVVALLVLGPKRLPEAGRALGKGIRDFRGAISGDEHEPHDQIVNQASSVEATQPKETAAPPAEPVQPIG